MPTSPLFFSFLLFFSLVSTDTIQQPKVFLHIGPHKTGTTSIQHAMAHNFDETLKEGYYFLPNAVERNPLLFAELFVHPYNNPTLPPVFRKKYADEHQLLLQQQQQQKTQQQQTQQQETQQPLLNWVISSENLDLLLNKTAVYRVREFFSGYNVTIVAFVRDHLEHLRSYWLQKSCHRQTRFPPLPQHLKKETDLLFAGEGSWPGEDMFQVLDLYQEVFGNGSIVLIDFDGVLAKPNSSLPQAFLNDIVGLKFGLSETSIIHENQRKQYINTLNMWFALDPEHGIKCEIGHRYMSEIQNKFNRMHFLERCEDQVDFDKLSRQLETYFDEGWKRRGWKVLYKNEGDEARKKKKGRGDCFVVKENRREDAKQIGRQFIDAKGWKGVLGKYLNKNQKSRLATK